MLWRRMVRHLLRCEECYVRSGRRVVAHCTDLPANRRRELSPTAMNRKFEDRLVPATVPRVRAFGLAVIAAAALLASAGATSASALLPTIDTFSPTGQNPAAIAIDWDGNIYTANYDTNNVSKFTPLGAPTTIFASTGAGSNPYGIMFHPAGFILIANYTSSTLTVISPDGFVLPTPVILPVGSGPQGMTFDAAGNLYTANFGSNNVSRIAQVGGAVTTLGSTGSRPNGITIDTAGNIYTSNFFSHTVTKITPGGLSTTLASTIPSGGTGNSPAGITIDSAGNIYTANRASNNVTKITPDGTASTLGVTGNSPIGITIDSAGNIYTANNDSNNVTRITPSGTTSILASTGVQPYAITIDANGSIYTSNQESGALTGTVTKISGGTDQIFASPPHMPYTAPSVVAGAELATVTVAPNEASAVYGTPSSYTVTALEDASKSCVVTMPATTCQVSGLASGTSYSFTSRAHLNTWQTAASPPSAAVTPTLAPPAAPPAPTAVAGDGTATVTVAAGSGNTPASYTVTASPGGRSCTVTGAAGSCLISGLTNGTGYRFTATATNAGGTSGSSAASSTVTPRSPLTVRSLKAKVGRASAYLSSRATVPTAGKITQAATTGTGRKKKTWCKAVKNATAAGSYTLKCNLGAKGRSRLRRQALKLTVTTVFRRSTGATVTKSSRLTIRRSR